MAYPAPTPQQDLNSAPSKIKSESMREGESPGSAEVCASNLTLSFSVVHLQLAGQFHVSKSLTLSVDKVMKGLHLSV